MSEFWNDLREDLKDPEFREAYVAESDRLSAESVAAQDAWSVVFEALCDSYDPYAEDGFSVTTGTEAVLDALRRAGLLNDGTGAAE